MKTLVFVFFDAGGGHRSAATAVSAILQRRPRPWDIALLNLQELLDPLDPFHRLAGVRLQDIYNRMLASGRTLGAGALLPPLHGLLRLYESRVVRQLERHWTKLGPAAVVSFVPHFNRALARSLRPAGTPLVTVLTDLADYPPHFWMEKESQYLVCGSDRAMEQARALGHPAHRTLRASGMILKPQFYDLPPLERGAERRKLGLDPDLPTGLVMFGGFGPPVMKKIAQALQHAPLELQLILICGRNDRLAAELRNLPGRMPMYVEGFTPNISYYMRLADFFVGKTGPGSISEAVAMHLPVVVERNVRTLPQERYNAQWIVENGVGIVLPHFGAIVDAVKTLLEPGALASYRDRCSRIRNRAVFEVADFLEQVATANGNAPA